MKTKRVFFVGVHNKKGCVPLDSKTISGKRIDMIIRELYGFECHKTNLFDLEYLPKGFCEKSAVQNWMDRTLVNDKDIVVALGGTVSSAFNKFYPGNLICRKHPSIVMGSAMERVYVEIGLNEIRNLSDVIC